MPSVPGLIGRLYVRRWSEWQSRQAETCSTRYLPRATRSGVASIFSVDGSRCAGFFSESHDTAPASSATTTNRAMPSTLKKVFILFGTPFPSDLGRIVLSGGAVPRHEERERVRKSDAG